MCDDVGCGDGSHVYTSGGVCGVCVCERGMDGCGMAHQGNVFSLPPANVSATTTPQPWLSTRQETLALLQGQLQVRAIGT